MKLPWVAGRVLDEEEFVNYRQEVKYACRHCDYPGDFPQTLIDFPLLMKPGGWPMLARLAEKLSREALAAEKEVLVRPDLLALLGLPAGIQKVIQGCRREAQPVGAARVMRFDFYFTTKGWKFSEANSDWQGGFVEAYGFTAPMVAYYPGYASPPDPAAIYAKAIRKAVAEGTWIVVLNDGTRWAVCRSQFVAKRIQNLGMRVILATPEELRWDSGRAQIGGSSLRRAPSLLVRFYDANFLPRRCRGNSWEPWFCCGKTPMSNPGTAILTESKRFPLTWKGLDAPMHTWHAYLPNTRCPTEICASNLKDWVLKPALGMTGRRVAIADITQKREFQKIAEQARLHPTKWVAQERFESVPVATERGPGHICLGIYTVDGVVAGAFARIRGKALINERALSIPVLIPERDAGTIPCPKVSGAR